MEGEQGAGAVGADGSNEANNVMLQQQQQQQQQQEETVRFEDLTVDDDLPILDRIVRYSQSQIALQRLVHVKMLGETAELSGMIATQDHLVPILGNLVSDGESVIRQHLAAQLLPVAIVCMVESNHNDHSPSSNGSGAGAGTGMVAELVAHPEYLKDYNDHGYDIVTSEILPQCLYPLVSDVDVDVRRAAADAITGLALQIHPDDIPTAILPIPLRLAQERAPAPPPPPSVPPPPNEDGSAHPPPVQPPPQGRTRKTEAEHLAEEWRITAANLLAELGGAVSEHKHLQQRCGSSSSSSSGGGGGWVDDEILTAVLTLTQDSSFRVRRAAAQALPRILGACSVAAVSERILPTFHRLSQDDLYRVRKSTGECLVDMSRSLMILASHQKDVAVKLELQELRRNFLIPIADRLIQDEHKMVRQGMMQFLGPFMASFYPFQDSTLVTALPATSEADGSNHMGIVAQFFPHATSMVSRLNSSHNAVTTAPTPVVAMDHILQQQQSSGVGNNNKQNRHGDVEMERLQKALPVFLQASRMASLSLQAVAEHRKNHPPDPLDIQAIVNGLLDYFAALAIVSTGDENTDAEMRVYCAYSFPAVVLLLGPENWQGAMKTCFFTLLNPSFASADDDPAEGGIITDPPLPVKRCLASSLHTISHVLGPEIASCDILPVVQDYFLRDADESVRLNIIRCFASLLQIAPAESPERREIFLVWSEIIHGEECLGAKKRSATNPLVLNWRQRDYLARSLPELLGKQLVPPDLQHHHLWPILQQLLTDGVSVVRDDAMWAVPMLLKSYCPETVGKWSQLIEDPKRFASESCTEVIDWLKDNILKEGGNDPENNINNANSNSRKAQVANFSERQLYCRICAAVGLALRFNLEYQKLAHSGTADSAKTPSYPLAATTSLLSHSFQSLFFGQKSDGGGGTDKGGGGGSRSAPGPYQQLTSYEHKHLRKLLVEHLLPPALKMKDDRIGNVRVTLMQVLLLMPPDIRESLQVKPVLQALVEEVATWQSFGGDDEEALLHAAPGATPGAPCRTSSNQSGSTRGDRSRGQPEAPPPQPPPTGAPTHRRHASSGPVDVDEVNITPNSSQDEDDDPPSPGKAKRVVDDVMVVDNTDDSDDNDAGESSPPTTEAEEILEDLSQVDKKQRKKKKKDKDKKRSGSSNAAATMTMDELPSSDDVNEDDFEKAWQEAEASPSSPSKRAATLAIGPIKDLSELERDEPTTNMDEADARARAVEEELDAAHDSFKAAISPRMKKTRGVVDKDYVKPAPIELEAHPIVPPPDVPELSREPSPTSKKKKKKSKDANSPPRAAVSEDDDDEAGWITVTFGPGSIGLQLEPIVDDRACRVYDFLDNGVEPSPARKSGKIKMGDVIVKVNGVSVYSYDETIDLLKKGGHREITFRPGTDSDDFQEGGAASYAASGGDDSSTHESHDQKKRKEAKKSKRPKKEKAERSEKKKTSIGEMSGDKKPSSSNDKKKDKKDKKKKKEAD